MNPVLGAAIIRETMALPLLARYDTSEVRVELLTIGCQESRFTARRQSGNGPARGFWQFESGGGVRGVMTHPVSKKLAQKLCEGLGVEFRRDAIYAALENNDVLACGFARLLLLTDPLPLPRLFQAQAAWDYYERNWRPGHPHRETWDAFYATAIQTITGEAMP